MLNHRNNSTGILINLSWSSLQVFLEPFRVACILKINYLRDQKNHKTQSNEGLSHDETHRFRGRRSHARRRPKNSPRGPPLFGSLYGARIGRHHDSGHRRHRRATTTSAPFSIHVFKGDSLGLVRLGVQLHGCRDGMAGPLLAWEFSRQRPEAMARCTARRSHAATSSGAASSMLRSGSQAYAAITGLMPHSSRWPA